MFFSFFSSFFPLLFSETHAPVDRLCMGREGRGAALSSLHLVRCLRLQWLCLRWPDNVRAPDLNWWDSIDCVRRRPGSVYTWFQLFTSHWLCQKTTWTSIHLVSTVHIPLTVSEDDLNQHTLGWDWWDSTDCVSEDDLGINTSLFWTSLIRLCVWRQLLSTHPWFEQNEILSTGLPLRDGLISSCLSLSALPVCGTSSLPTFVSTACVWYSHHFLPLSAKPVCGTPITSCLSLSSPPAAYWPRRHSCLFTHTCTFHVRNIVHS